MLLIQILPSRALQRLVDRPGLPPKPKALKLEMIVKPPIKLHGVPVRQTPRCCTLEHLVNYRGLLPSVPKLEEIVEPLTDLFLLPVR